MFRVESRIDIRSSMASLPFYIKCSNRSNLIAIKCTNNMHLVANHVSLNLRYRTDSFLEWFEFTSKIFEESIGDVVKIHVINRIGVNLCIIEIVITKMKTTMEEKTQTRENQRHWLRINESKQWPTTVMSWRWDYFVWVEWIVSEIGRGMDTRNTFLTTSPLVSHGQKMVIACGL